MEHLVWTARQFAEKDCDIVVQIGDFGEWGSLGQFDSKVRKAISGASVQDDLDSVNKGLDMLEVTWEKMGWQPKRKVFLHGNHEYRIDRFLWENPELAGLINHDKTDFKPYGWEVYPFLKVVYIEDVAFSHFFPRGPTGKALQQKHGAPDAKTQVKRAMRSTVAGHSPGLDTCMISCDDRMYRGVILGSSYLHDPAYQGYQGTNYWRGVLIFHNMKDGMFNISEYPLENLRWKFERYKS